MKKLFFLSSILICSLIIPFQLFAQEGWIYFGRSKVYPEGKMFEYSRGKSETSNIDQWLLAGKIVAERKDEYIKNGWINPAKSHPKFILPLHVKDLFTEPGYYTITAYFDHDTLLPNHLQDYTCGTLTYDLESGYNHEGTDFFLWPYPWHKMANNEVEVVAAAPGILLFKQDGNFDQQCELNSEEWNGVCILHDDGFTSWYIHMKKNSLTDKNVGEEIAQGEYLGIVGSSGSSLAPHLHFEVLDADENKIDPFFGSCNEAIGDSWWEEQLPYKEPGVNKISTNAHLPVFPDCPEEEIPNESEVFYPGDSIFLLSYFRNISWGDQVEVTIRRPNNSVFANWFWTNPYDFYAASWVYFLMFLNDENYGTWNYQLNFNGGDYYKSFELKDPQGTPYHSYQDQLKIFPVPFENMINLESANFQRNSSLIKIYNSMGQWIRNIQINPNLDSAIQVDLSNLPSGIYFIRLEFGNENLYKRIVKK